MAKEVTFDNTIGPLRQSLTRPVDGDVAEIDGDIAAAMCERGDLVADTTPGDQDTSAVSVLLEVVRELGGNATGVPGSKTFPVPVVPELRCVRSCRCHD